MPLLVPRVSVGTAFGQRAVLMVCLSPGEREAPLIEFGRGEPCTEATQDSCKPSSPSQVPVRL